MTLELEAAWETVHDALPARWSVRRPSYDPGRHAWSISAIAPHPGRDNMPTVVTGNGTDEVAALRDLDNRLRRGPQPGGSRHHELQQRARLAYIAGAVGRWLDMTADELARVIGRAPV